MEYKKTLPLILGLLLSFATTANSVYLGPSYSFAWVVSENDFYNGANDGTPGLVAGAKFGVLSLDIFLREFSLLNEHTDANGTTYELEVKNLLYGGGMRIEILPSVDFLLGVNAQNVSTKYSANKTNAILKDPIDTHYFSWYLGGGLNINWSEKFFSRVDAVYYKGSFDYSLFALDFVFLYRVISL